MPGVTKSIRMKKLNRFSTDISMQCQAEFENVHRKTAGDAKKYRNIFQPQLMLFLNYTKATKGCFGLV